MKIQDLLFYGILILIILLLAFNFKITSLKNSFVEACVVDYKPYLEKNTCPCSPPDPIYSYLNSFNFSNININMSVNE